MSARPYPLPRGVTEAEAKRESRILAEYLRGQQETLNEQHQLHLYFTSPSWTIGEIAKCVNEYRMAGFAVTLRGLVDAKGDTYGIELVGDLR